MNSTHSPAPWKWGDGFGRLGREDFGESPEDKYADCRLIGGDGEDVISIRIDHYEPTWDMNPCSGFAQPSKFDRALIESSPEMLAMLRRLQWANRSDDDPSCPICERYKAGIGHAQDCQLAALIAKAEGR